MGKKPRKKTSKKKKKKKKQEEKASPWLTTEEHGDIRGATADTVTATLSEDAFGSFAVLSVSEDRFIQAACAWEPNEATTQFLKRYDSDPWTLELRTPAGLLRVDEALTLQQVIETFLAFLDEVPQWRERFTWKPAS